MSTLSSKCEHSFHIITHRTGRPKVVVVVIFSNPKEIFHPRLKPGPNFLLSSRFVIIVGLSLRTTKTWRIISRQKELCLAEGEIISYNVELSIEFTHGPTPGATLYSMDHAPCKNTSGLHWKLLSMSCLLLILVFKMFQKWTRFDKRASACNGEDQTFRIFKGFQNNFG